MLTIPKCLYTIGKFFPVTIAHGEGNLIREFGRPDLCIRIILIKSSRPNYQKSKFTLRGAGWFLFYRNRKSKLNLNPFTLHIFTCVCTYLFSFCITELESLQYCLSFTEFHNFVQVDFTLIGVSSVLVNVKFELYS